MEIQYNLKKINIDASKGEKIEYPPLLDRIIEVHGQVFEVTLAEVVAQQLERVKRLKEWEGKFTFEKAKMENIEHHHPFVKELSAQDLQTAWMYFQAQVTKTAAEVEIEKLNGYIASEKAQLSIIKEQIPELSDIALEVQQMLDKRGEEPKKEEAQAEVKPETIPTQNVKRRKGAKN